MKIMMKHIWDSIDRIMFPELPRKITAKECGFSIPEALEKCAVCMVRDDRHTDDYYRDPHQRMLDEQNVIDGLREIRQNGFIEFTDTKGIL